MMVFFKNVVSNITFDLGRIGRYFLHHHVSLDVCQVSSQDLQILSITLRTSK